MLKIIITGPEEEVKRWLAIYQRQTCRKVNYIGAKTEDGGWTVILQEGTKENCPRMRTVKKFVGESEQISDR